MLLSVKLYVHASMATVSIYAKSCSQHNADIIAVSECVLTFVDTRVGVSKTDTCLAIIVYHVPSYVTETQP